MKEINAVGLACPMPVVKTKQAIDAGEREICTLVDNATAVENLTRLAQSCSYTVTVSGNVGVFSVMLCAQGAMGSAAATPTPAQAESEATVGDWAVFVSGEHLGRGSDELGETLMSMFFYTLAQGNDLPSQVLLINGGVRLPCESDEVVAQLTTLEQRGCEVLVCGACLNFYNLKEKLRAGSVSNMYEILERMRRASKVISL